MQILKKYWWLALIIVLLLVRYLWLRKVHSKKTTEQCEQDIAEADKQAATARQAPLPNAVTIICPHGEKTITTRWQIQLNYLKSKGWKENPIQTK